MMYCIEYFYAKPQFRQLLIESLLALTKIVKNEKGCLQYDLIQDSHNPNLIILVVQFSDPQTMQQHEQQPYIQKFAENELKQYCDKMIWNDGAKL